MAIDTATKRYSVIGFDLPFVRMFPVPDGTISATDRQGWLWKYTGIAFSAPVISSLVPRLMLLGAGCYLLWAWL